MRVTALDTYTLKEVDHTVKKAQLKEITKLLREIEAIFVERDPDISKTMHKMYRKALEALYVADEDNIEIEQISMRSNLPLSEKEKNVIALRKALEALQFYADPETYHGIAYMVDNPGPFMEDGGDELNHPLYNNDKPGRKAREALKEIVEILKDDTL